MALDDMTDMARGVLMLVISVVILVIMGLIFFTIDLWIVDTAAELLDIDVTGNGGLVVLSAAILSAAALIGSKGRHG
ncbi:MAG: hypothetical protein ACP5FL_05110 [Thermoplasmatota archaeon]